NVSNLEKSDFKKGHVLLEEGKPGKAVYVLDKGCVKIVADGNEICKVSEPMAIFGEISLLLNTSVSANVIVDVDSSFYVIEDFPKYLSENSDAALYLSRLLAQRLVD